MTNPPTEHPVRFAFKRIPPAPRPGVILDLVYFAPTISRPEYWLVRLYRENLNSLDLSAEHMLAVHNWVSDIMRQLRAVEPNVYLEINDRIPREVQ